METNFIEEYNKVAEGKKLDFLRQLLLKDSDLQKQFLEFATVRNSDVDDITAINIDEVRNELWDEISIIDIDEIVENNYGDYAYDDYGWIGEEIFENIFSPFTNKALNFIDKGNYLDAFRILLAIYEVSIVEAPVIADNYYVFNEDIGEYIKDFVLSIINSFDSKIKQKVLSLEMVNSLIKLFFSRYKNCIENRNEFKDCYKISHFSDFFESIVEKSQNAKYLLEKIREYGLNNSIDSANAVLHCADIISDDKLYLNIANKFFMSDDGVALKLQKKYKELGLYEELAKISSMLFEKEDNADYALFIIENIDKQTYKDLFVKALKIYIDAYHSIEYYKLLREYVDKEERLKFVESFEDSYNKLFFIQLLEIEKQYEKILEFAKKNKNSYNLKEILNPIVSIYPEQVFEIIMDASEQLIEERGRTNYAMACELLKLMVHIPQGKNALKAYVDRLYNHQPRLPALRDELNKAGLLYI